MTNSNAAPTDTTLEHHVYDPNFGGNGIVGSYVTLEEAVHHAQDVVLVEYRRESIVDGEWSMDVEDIRVFRATSPEDCEENGIVVAKAVACDVITRPDDCGEDGYSPSLGRSFSRNETYCDYKIEVLAATFPDALPDDSISLTANYLVSAGLETTKAKEVAEYLTKHGVGHIPSVLKGKDSEKEGAVTEKKVAQPIPTLNQWFLGLEKGRQDVLKGDKWMLADASYQDGVTAGANPAI